ncbi:MAG: hypothetical protein QF510_05155 [Rhodospirillales bacterium]|nr:hypothetical protein [Rhodospirillales bacterium]
MVITAILGTTLSGLLASATQANAAAINFVNQNTPDDQPVQASSMSLVIGGASASVRTQIPAKSKPFDLRRGFSGLIAAEVAYVGNVTILRTADEHIDELIDLIV